MSFLTLSSVYQRGRAPVRGKPPVKTCQPENECFLVKGYDITILNFISLLSFRGNVSERGQRWGGGEIQLPFVIFYAFLFLLNRLIFA